MSPTSTSACAVLGGQGRPCAFLPCHGGCGCGGGSPQPEPRASSQPLQSDGQRERERENERWMQKQNKRPAISRVLYCCVDNWESCLPHLLPFPRRSASPFGFLRDAALFAFPTARSAGRRRGRATPRRDTGSRPVTHSEVRFSLKDRADGGRGGGCQLPAATMPPEARSCC